MFEDIFNITSRHMDKFCETVRDEFGQSIVTDIFEPILQDIYSLQQLSELYQVRAAEINQMTEELQSIGGIGHE